MSGRATYAFRLSLSPDLQPVMTVLETQPSVTKTADLISPVLVMSVFVLMFCIYALTGSQLGFGYEGQNISQLEAWLQGNLQRQPDGLLQPYTQGGILDIGLYLPASLLKLVLGKHEALPGLRQLAYTFMNPLAGAAICTIFLLLSMRLYRNVRTAVLLTLLMGLATMVWPYSKFGMENLQTFWTLCGLWALLQYRERPGLNHAVIFGLSLVALLLSKITGILQVAALGLIALYFISTQKLWLQRGVARHALVVAIMVMAGLAVLIITNHARYGAWGIVSGRYNPDFEFIRYPLWEAAWSLLASPGKSMVLFNPVLLLSAWFGLSFFRRFPELRLPALLFAGIMVFHVRMHTWADETWGPRRLHWMIPLLCLPLGLWIEQIYGIRTWVRRAGRCVVLLGFTVQLIAISFDYTALPKTAGKTALYSQENYVWEPQFCPIRFNLHLARSLMHKYRTGESLPWIYTHHYLAVTAPENPPPPIVHPVDEVDEPDFWWFQQQKAWSDQPYWFHSRSSWFVFIFMAGILVSTWLIRRNLNSGIACNS
jgi:hypothetical protein